MKMLNDEFNYFRGLFPLKVFITGPPCSGKTFFASQLSEQYGIPHLRIKDIIDYALSLDNDFGKQLKAKIEEHKDQAEADYEKSRKKKDPDFDRESYNPRLTDDILADLVKFQLGSAACMNKGFILDGFPRSKEDAQLVFTNEVPIEKPEKEGDEDPEGAGEEEPQTKREINEKILPQYCIAFEADDAFLSQRAKDIPPEQVEGTHFNDAGMARRLKEYRTRNPDDSGNTVKDFITETIGYPNVLVVDASIPNNEQLTKMQEIIEQKGKPCCINMITDDDKKFLANLEKIAAKAARQKARAEAAAQAEAEGQEEGEEGKPDPAQLESEEEVDEITLLIQKEEKENAEAAIQEEAQRKQKAAEAEIKKVKDAKEAIKMEKLRE